MTIKPRDWIILAIVAVVAGWVLGAGGGNRQTQALEIEQIRATADLNKQTELYLTLIERVGPVQAQEDLFRSGLPFTGQTHLLNHAVGDYLYNKYKSAGLIYCKDYFLSSCAHGFVLRAIGEGGMFEVEKVMEECRKSGGPAFAQCSHAVGHGFLAEVGYSQLLQALDLCDKAGGLVSQFPLFNCHDGVFMENIWGVHEGTPSPDRWIDPADPFYPCNDSRISAEYLNACWSNQPSLMYQQFFGDLAKVGVNCDRVKEEVYKITCFDGLARQIHPLTENKLDKVDNLCGLMPQPWVNFCKITITSSAFSVGDREIPYQICQTIKGPDQDACYDRLSAVIAAYAVSQEDHNKLCAKIDNTQWRERCKPK